MPKALTQIAEKNDMPEMISRAAIIPGSVDENARTIRVQYTTGARVFRPSLWDEDYYEELSLEKGHVRLDRFKSGSVPVLNSHRNYDLADIIGTVIEADESHATIQFSQRPELEGIWRDIVAGVIRNISVGYRVYKYEDITPDDDKIRVLRAIDWEPLEVSFVAIPADGAAGTRSNAKTNRCVIVGARDNLNEDEETMSKKTEQGARAEDKNKKVRTEDENNTPAPAETEGGEGEENTDATGTDDAPVDENAAGETADERSLSDAEKRGVEKERKRVSDIRAMVRSLDLDDKVAEDLIQKGVTVDKARAAVIEQMADKDEKTNTRSDIRVGEDLSRKSRNEAIENYILHRANPAKIELTQQGREYRGMTLLDVAREIVGHKECRGLNRNEIVQRAFHSTSDFSEIMSSVIGRSLRRGYENTRKTFLPIARRIVVPDFRERQLIALSNAPSLEKVLEGGEYKYGTVSDTGEPFRISTFGKILAVTRQVIINDDLDALTSIPQKMAAAAGRLENRLVYDLLTSNPTLSDGIALFHADHGNLTDGLLTTTGIGKIRKLMRVQTDPSGEDILNIEPKHLVVPAALEETALKGKATIVPNVIANSQPFASTYDIITEGYLDGNSETVFYMAADPDEAGGLVYGYLEGEEGPYIETRTGFDRDGVEFKVRHDFGVGVEDFRGLAKSTNNGS